MSRRTHRLVVAALALAMCPAAVARAQARAVDESQQTAEALTALANRWSDAEAQGDTAYLARLLAPEYRSVNADGSIHGRRQLIAGAATHGSPAAVAKLAEWRASHHSGTHVVIVGETAVVSYYPGPDNLEAPISSSDIFVYRDHRWQALYSAHTTHES